MSFSIYSCKHGACTAARAVAGGLNLSDEQRLRLIEELQSMIAQQQALLPHPDPGAEGPAALSAPVQKEAGCSAASCSSAAAGAVGRTQRIIQVRRAAKGLAAPPVSGLVESATLQVEDMNYMSDLDAYIRSRELESASAGIPQGMRDEAAFRNRWETSAGPITAGSGDTEPPDAMASAAMCTHANVASSLTPITAGDAADGDAIDLCSPSPLPLMQRLTQVGQQHSEAHHSPNGAARRAGETTLGGLGTCSTAVAAATTADGIPAVQLPAASSCPVLWETRGAEPSQQPAAAQAGGGGSFSGSIEMQDLLQGLIILGSPPGGSVEPPLPPSSAAQCPIGDGSMAEDWVCELSSSDDELQDAATIPWPKAAPAATASQPGTNESCPMDVSMQDAEGEKLQLMNVMPSSQHNQATVSISLQDGSRWPADTGVVVPRKRSRQALPRSHKAAVACGSHVEGRSPGDAAPERRLLANILNREPSTKAAELGGNRGADALLYSDVQKTPPTLAARPSAPPGDSWQCHSLCSPSPLPIRRRLAEAHPGVIVIDDDEM